MSTLLETERLRLERWTDAAVDELLEMHNQPEVSRYFDIDGKGWDRARAEGRLTEWQDLWAECGLGKHRLVRRDDGAFVGRAGFGRFGDDFELGYTLRRGHWGHGYATEIAGALGEWFFATRSEPRFTGYAHRDNAASRRVLSKIGMVETYAADVAGMPHQFYEKRRSQA